MWSFVKNWWETRKSRNANVQAGVQGERLAASFLKKEHGYKVIARNWRSPRDRRDEIDLVCRDGEVLVFVEVKTRAAEALVSGYHAVDKAKKRVMLRACTDYLRRLGERRQPPTYRFDIVEVQRAANGDDPVVRHYENIPLFSEDRHR
jgi:putative endonuclease